MLIYIISLISTAIFMNVAQSYFLKKDLFRERLYFLLAFIPLFVVAAFRYEVGTDFASYATAFRYDWAMEPGFTFIIKMIHLITDNQTAFFAVTSALMLIPVFGAIKKLSVNWSLSIALYVLLQYYFMFLNGIRQGIAVGIILYAAIFMIQKRLIMYFLMCAVAVSIHKSAIIMLPLYFICSRRYTRKQYTVTLFFAPVIFVATKPIVLNIASKIYGVYLGNELYLPSSEEILIMIIVNIAILTILMLKNNVKNNTNPYYYVLVNLQVLGTLSLFFAFILPQYNRISFYFNIFWIIIIPWIYQNTRGKYLRAIMMIMIVILGILFFYWRIVRGGVAGVLPYQSIWS